jgi:hypothetical protein
MAKASDAPMGTGMVRKAANSIQNDQAYKRYVIETQTNGEDPMSMDDFLASQKRAKAEEDDAYRAEMKA